MGNKMTEIRRATQRDAAVVAELVARLFVELCGVRYDLVDIAHDLLSRSDRVIGILAYDGRHPIGVLLLSEGYALFAMGAFGQITELYVRPEYRSAGIAARLVEAAALLGKERGWHRIEVGAPDQPKWKRTLNFYKTRGFTEIGPRLRLDL
jgi:GNAT superfamily N-acetyltransferase